MSLGAAAARTTTVLSRCLTSAAALKGEDTPPPREQPATADDDLVRVVNVALVTGVIQPAEIRAAARKHSVAASDGEEPLQTASSTPYDVPLGLAALAMPIALGFIRPWQFFDLLGPASFGHGGAGGSLAIGDPESGIGFAYVMNRMAYDERRATTLLSAVKKCLT